MPDAIFLDTVCRFDHCIAVLRAAPVYVKLGLNFPVMVSGQGFPLKFFKIGFYVCFNIRRIS